MQRLDPRLLATLEAVVRHGSFNAAARELGYSAPAVSQQIAELRDAGLIVGRKESKNMFYRLADGRVKEFIEQMHRMFCAPQPSDDGDKQ